MKTEKINENIKCKVQQKNESKTHKKDIIIKNNN